MSEQPKWRSVVPTIGAHNNIYGPGRILEQRRDPGSAEYEPANKAARDLRDSISAHHSQEEVQPPFSHLVNSGGRTKDGAIIWRQRKAVRSIEEPDEQEPLWTYNAPDGMYPAYPAGVMVRHRAEKFAHDGKPWPGMRACNAAAASLAAQFSEKAA